MNGHYDLVLLLGGTGTRMDDKPHDNKHLVDVSGKTMVEHIKEKVDRYESANQPFLNKYVVTNGKGVEQIMKILGQDYKYFYQERPTGIPDAAFIPNPKNKFLLHLGDQYYEDQIGAFMEGFYDKGEDYRAWLKYTKDTNHTVALLDGDWNLKRFVEKPRYHNDQSAYVATGMYMLDPSVGRLIKHLPRNEKGENNMSDLGNLVNNETGRVGYKMMKGYWYDIGSQEIRRAAQYKMGELVGR